MRTRTTRLDSAFIAPLKEDEEGGDSDDDDTRIKVNDDDDDDDDIEEIRSPLYPDVEFGNEIGYSLVVSLRGRTTGRRLKRNLFCLGAIQLLVGTIVIIISDQAARSFEVTDFFSNSMFGKRLLSLWWLSSIIALLLSFPHFFMVFYWASLVTNRLLLMTVVRLVMLVQLVNWIFVLATVITTFRTFGEKISFTNTTKDQKLLSYYLSSVFLLFPYLLCICNFSMDLSYLNDEIDYGGTVAEADPPPDTWDLTGLSLQELMRQIIAYPIALVYQTIELAVAVYNLLRRLWARVLRYMDDRALAHEQQLARAKLEKKKRKSLVTRMWRTLQRCCKSLVKGRSRSERYRLQQEREAREAEAAAAQKALESEQLLRSVTRDKDEAARLEAEREAMEKERAYLRERDERLRREAAEAQAERDRLEKEEALRRRKEEEDSAPTMSVNEFKERWTSLPVAGQFQCKLKDHPSLLSFTEHLRKQGFHIVFAATPSPNDVEIGVCNIRTGAGDPRFLGRFLSSQLSFSAVMKAEQVDKVPDFVKRFALAKVLKIDTSASAAKR